MTGPGVRVPRSVGEATRRRLRELGLLRDDLAIDATGDTVDLPVRSWPEPPLPDAEPITRAFEPRPPPKASSYQELAAVPERLRPWLPRSFDVVGDLVIVRVPPELDPYASEIGRALRSFVPGTRLVAADRGVQGATRVRRLERLAGEGPFTTVHRENGLEFAVDLERAYFSPRLGREHARISALGRPGERVLDLCCGVGPFGITLLRRGVARATLVDLNPDAVALARANADRAGVGARAVTVVADLTEFLPSAGAFDRVVYNLPREGIKYEPQVGTAVAGGGALHSYEIMERSGRRERLEARRRALPGPGAWTLVDHRVVHAYSPTSDLVAATFRRGPA